MRPGSRPRGFSYIGLLILVAVLGVAASAGLVLGEISQRRQAEQSLLQVGAAYRDAIGSFYLAVPPEKRRYPIALTELLRDPRFPTLRRHLRRLYPDPITGQSDWLLLRNPDGGITGIASRSSAKPIKLDLFDQDDAAFRHKQHYWQWQFVGRTSEAVEKQ